MAYSMPLPEEERLASKAQRDMESMGKHLEN